MFALEHRRAPAYTPAIVRRPQHISSFEPGSAPVLLRKVCPCGGGCSNCAAESSRDELDAASSIQARLEIGAVDDPLEREADRVADHVVRMDAAQPCNCGGTCAKCRPASETSPPDIVQRTPLNAAALDSTRLPDHVHTAVHSPGHVLDSGTRDLFESRFGHDFSGVRIHSDHAAAASAQALNALAYTLGRDVVFNSGQYSPSSTQGRHLLAHELTHVVQQTAAPGSSPSVLRRAPLCTQAPKALLPSKAEFATNEELNNIRQLALRRNYDSDLPLQSGDEGASVALIQRVLLNTVCDSVNRDALAAELASRQYGKETVKAVARFQQTHTDSAGEPLSRDGEVGPLTLGAMDVVLGLTPQGPMRQQTSCYGEAKNGPGEIETFSDSATGETRWVLSNFDVDRNFVKQEHRAFIQNTIVPAVNSASPPDAWQVIVLGEASTTASFGYNLELSWRRERCVAQALRDTGLDPARKITLEAATGELRGDIEQIARGESPFLGKEDPAKRRVTIALSRKAACRPEAAAKEFSVAVVCDSPYSVRITILALDPVNPRYREFVWRHEAWPPGCTLLPGEPPSFAPHLDWVKTATALRLARDPDNLFGPSDFDGEAIFFGFGADQYLVHAIGTLPYPLFRIGMGGVWKSPACNRSMQEVRGYIYPIGPATCGEPEFPEGQCRFEGEDPCSDDHKMSASKRFNGGMIAASTSLDILPDWAKRLMTVGVAGAIVELGTKDTAVDPSLTRKFVFAGGGISGGGSGLDHFKGATAKDQDLPKPARLANEDPGARFADSDFDDYTAKLEFHGGSKKITLTTEAGTLTFINALCNDGSRTYYGLFQPIGRVQCPDHLDLPDLEDSECKEEKCSDKIRLAGHKRFTIKVGRATLASLPEVGRRLAQHYGCKVTAAFVHIQSEDGPDEKRIHREFVVLLYDLGCEFTVGQGRVSFDGYFERQLATEKPDEIFSDSDFAGAARLSKEGDLALLSRWKWPVIFPLPGAFDPGCIGKGALGIAVPYLPVECGETPDPIHDTTTAPTHQEQCAALRKQNPWMDNVIDDLRHDKFADYLDNSLPGYIWIPDALFDEYLKKPGSIQNNALFVGLAANPGGGPPIRFAAFADIRIIDVDPIAGTMDIEFLKDLCAFDEHGRVILIKPEGCIDGIGRKGMIYKVSPRRLRRKKPTRPDDVRTA